MSDKFSFMGDLLKAGIQRTGIQSAVREKMAGIIWSEVVGEKTSSVTRVDSVRDGIMYVNCRDSMWAQQLHFLRPQLVKKINERLGGKIIKEIRLSGVGFRAFQQQKPDTPKPEKKVSLTKAESNTIEEAAMRVEDPDLAERVLRGLKANKLLIKKMEK